MKSLMKEDRPQPTPNEPNTEPEETTPEPTKQKTFINQYIDYLLKIVYIFK